MFRGPEERLRFIAALLIAVVVAIVAQLINIQLIKHEEIAGKVDEAVRREFKLPEPPWGVITDRNGDYLVCNSSLYDVGAEVKSIGTITETREAATTLAPLLGMGAEELTAAMTPKTPGDTFEWRRLAYGISGNAATEVISISEHLWPWLTMEPRWLRVYPEGQLAAHLLGFVNADGFGYGVEAYLQRFLEPQQVALTGNVTVETFPMPGEFDEDRQFIPYPGTDIRLTIDRTIQAYVEGELDKGLVEFSAESGSILVMNPQNGAIIAAASRPTYEPGRYPDYADQTTGNQSSIFVDPMISIPYEPGSGFKVVTVAAALDSGLTDMNWSYVDTGSLEYGGVTVKNWNLAAYQQQGLQGILTYSLNTGAATLTTRVMGANVFYDYVRKFGFGQKTGISSTGEVAGTVHLPSHLDWSDSYLATNSFGQGISVTPLQLASAFMVIANDGRLMQPYVVSELHLPDGTVKQTQPKMLVQVIKEETADAMAMMLETVVADNVTAAQVPNYRVAGKSGTAQIPVPGGYDDDDVIATFVGFGPMPDPQVLVLVKLDRPQVPLQERWGTRTSAVVFERVIERVFVLLGIPPSNLSAGR